MSARASVTRALPWTALVVVAVFAFVQLHERRRAEAAGEAPATPALSRTATLEPVATDPRPIEPATIEPADDDSATPPAAEPAPDRKASIELARARAVVGREAALRAVAEARVDALTREIAELRAKLEQRPVATPAPVGTDDEIALVRTLLAHPERGAEIARRVAVMGPGPGTDALVVHLVTGAPDAASAEDRLRTLGAVRVLRPPVLEQLLAPDASAAHEALLAWSVAADAGWTELERTTLARVVLPRMRSDDDDVARVARRFQEHLGLDVDR